MELPECLGVGSSAKLTLGVTPAGVVRGKKHEKKSFLFLAELLRVRLWKCLTKGMYKTRFWIFLED